MIAPSSCYPFIFVSHLLKNIIHSPWVGKRQFWSGSSLFFVWGNLVFSISLSIKHTAKTQRTQQMPMLIWVFALWCFWTDADQFIWIFWIKQYPIWSARILVSCYFAPFSIGPYFRENMYKIGKFLIWWVGYFPDKIFCWGTGLLYEDNRLFHGPCIDNLGSVVNWRGGGILYYTTGKFTQKPELH